MIAINLTSESLWPDECEKPWVKQQSQTYQGWHAENSFSQADQKERDTEKQDF